MKAIVVDDSMVIRSIIEKFLAPMGWEALHAANGKLALELLDRHAGEVNLMLLDWNMPVLDGVETIRSMKARDDCGHICIVMVSTESEDDKIDQAVAAGAHGYLNKPFTEAEFAAAVRRIFLRFKTGGGF